MTIELVPLCTINVALAAPFILPDTPSGTRVIVEVESFDVTGERLTGRLKGRAAADWLTLDSRAQGTVDVRALVETDDGALVYVTYRGRLDLSGGPGSAPVYSAPLFETGDERYLWLNKIQALAKGETTADGETLAYEVYEVS
jgi:hypothetical protein